MTESLAEIDRLLVEREKLDERMREINAQLRHVLGISKVERKPARKTLTSAEGKALIGI